MNSHPYRILMGAGFAMLVGVAGAQTYGNQPSSTAVDKNAPQPTQAQPSTPTGQTGADQASRLPAVKGATENPSQAESAQPTDKMSGQTNAQEKAPGQQSRKTAAAKSTKPAHQATKSHSHSQLDQTAMQGDKAYREALRQCAKEANQNARDSCLDTAIEQFHRNT